jgi:hypothetical protein
MTQKINEVDIRITRAEVTAVTIGLEDGVWKLSIAGNLISETGHVMTSFNYSSHSWNDEAKIEVPLAASGLGAKLFEMIEPIIIKKIQGHFNALTDGKGE